MVSGGPALGLWDVTPLELVSGLGGLVLAFVPLVGAVVLVVAMIRELGK